MESPGALQRGYEGSKFWSREGLEMPKKGEDIRKRKDGRWEGRYQSGEAYDGMLKYASIYGKSYAEVKEKLLAAKTLPETQRRSSKKLFGEILSEWLDTQTLRNKPSTQVKFGNLIRNHIAPALGNLALSQITTARLTRFMKDKAEHGRMDGQGGLSNSTLQALLLILKSTLEYAAQERYMPPMTFTLKCPEVKRESAKTLTVKEQAMLERSLRSELDASKLGILLCLYTGLRIGEVCALHWRDIDLANGLIYVRQTVQRLQDKAPSPERKTVLFCDLPKSERSLRSVPIPPCLMGLLRTFRGKTDGYVLTGQQDKLMEPRTYQYRFKRYIVDAGVADVNFHVLRHTFGTRFIELGGDPKTLFELLGHASVEITLNKYVHPSLEIKRQQMERFSVMRGMDSGIAAT
jgi:integrase